MLPANGEPDKYFTNNLDHTEELVTESSYDLQFKIAQTMYQRGFKTVKKINIQLRLEDNAEIESGRLSNMLKKIRRIEEAAPILTIGELKEACIRNDFPINPNSDEPFVYGKYIDDHSLSFRILFSTKRLLEVATLAKNIHLDGTYKLNYMGFPLIVVGSSDDARVIFITNILCITAKSL